MKTQKAFTKVLISILCLSIIVGGYIFINKNKKNSANSNPSQETANNSKDEAPKQSSYEFIETTYFAPVTGLKNSIVNISIADLSKSDKVYVTEVDKNLISNLKDFSSLKFSILPTDLDIIKILNKEKTSLALMNVSSLNFKVKTLSINGKFLFDKNLDLETYPLKVITSSKSNVQIADLSNYSHSRLTKLGHTGAMIPARGVIHHIEKKFKGDYKKLFESTKPLLDTFDFTSATFESPVLGKGQYCDDCMSFVGPDTFMQGVQYSGIDLFSLAANHIMNGGVAALDNTQKQLDKIDIKHIGASTKNNDEAGKPILVGVNGLKIAYLAFNDTPGYEEWALENRGGAASISDVEVIDGKVTKYEPNEERIKYFFDRAKDLNPDMIFVIMHWGGQEYVNEALPYQEKLAKLLVDNGADVILGDHPHWVQEMQVLSDKPVFYCVGNYIFDQMWSIETRQGIIIELDYVDKKLVNFRLHPHQLYLYDKGMPVLLTPDQKEYKQTLDRVWEETDLDF
jgi:poly-gamma-glutamate synthesis protein (capsule biosynthesis protein)